jgi:hypothetical protein
MPTTLFGNRADNLSMTPLALEGTMQVTIDDRQPLGDVLRVIGALYDVDLAVANGDSPQRRTANRPRRGASRPRASRSGRRKGPAASDVRTWARENGHEIRDRGRVPAAVIEAFNAAR